MQFKLFTIPIGQEEKPLYELNLFLRTKKVLEVQNQLVSNQNGAYWCFCVKYIETYNTAGSETKTKVDYKNVLDEKTFEKFSKLREIRKQVAAEEGIPAFAIFTDEELAGLAKLNELTKESMLTVKGVGEKKVERYGKYFIKEKDEKNGKPIS